MIGVVDASKVDAVRDRVFSEVGGYGFVTTNGSLYHRGRKGMRYGFVTTNGSLYHRGRIRLCDDEWQSVPSR